MVFKTLIAATCAAALAGSMVYFSTAPSNSGGTVKLDKPATEQVQPVKIATNEQKSSIMDRYISRKDKDETGSDEGDNPYQASNEEQKQSDFQVDAHQPSKNKDVIRKKPVRTKKLSSNDPAQQRIDVVFKQARLIKQVDLRDRAYLDLADYATNKGLFDQAQKAVLRINQPELRDTARSRIAMGMARYGMADEAFDLIGKVEVKELQDVMRLQVIEALLGATNQR